MKKLFLISLFAFISAGAIADDIPQPPMETIKHEPHKMGMMAKMSDEQKEETDCMRKAMESCGIEMPKRPEHNDHEKPDFPRGDKPQHPDMAETK